MDLITYNKPEDSERRKEAKNITFEEEKAAADMIDACVQVLKQKGIIPQVEIDSIQRFVDNYQNLRHHKDTTVNLYATDVPSIIEKLDKDVFWKITF